MTEQTVLVYPPGAGGEFIGSYILPDIMYSTKPWNRYHSQTTIPGWPEVSGHRFKEATDEPETHLLKYIYSFDTYFKTKQEYLDIIDLESEEYIYYINNWGKSYERTFWLAHHDYNLTSILPNTKCIFFVSNSFALRIFWVHILRVKNEFEFLCRYNDWKEQNEPTLEVTERNRTREVGDQAEPYDVLIKKVKKNRKQKLPYGLPEESTVYKMLQLMSSSKNPDACFNEFEKNDMFNEYLKILNKIKETKPNISFITPNQLDIFKDGLFEEYKKWVERNIQLFNDVSDIDFAITKYIHYE